MLNNASKIPEDSTFKSGSSRPVSDSRSAVQEVNSRKNTPYRKKRDDNPKIEENNSSEKRQVLFLKKDSDLAESGNLRSESKLTRMKSGKNSIFKSLASAVNFEPAIRSSKQNKPSDNDDVKRSSSGSGMAMLKNLKSKSSNLIKRQFSGEFFRENKSVEEENSAIKISNSVEQSPKFRPDDSSLRMEKILNTVESSAVEAPEEESFQVKDFNQFSTGILHRSSLDNSLRGTFEITDEMIIEDEISMDDRASRKVSRSLNRADSIDLFNPELGIVEGINSEISDRIAALEATVQKLQMEVHNLHGFLLEVESRNADSNHPFNDFYNLKNLHDANEDAHVLNKSSSPDSVEAIVESLVNKRMDDILSTLSLKKSKNLGDLTFGSLLFSETNDSAIDGDDYLNDESQSHSEFFRPQTYSDKFKTSKKDSMKQSLNNTLFENLVAWFLLGLQTIIFPIAFVYSVLVRNCFVKRRGLAQEGTTLRKSTSKKSTSNGSGNRRRSVSVNGLDPSRLNPSRNFDYQAKRYQSPQILRGSMYSMESEISEIVPGHGPEEPTRSDMTDFDDSRTLNKKGLSRDSRHLLRRPSQRKVIEEIPWMTTSNKKFM